MDAAAVATEAEAEANRWDALDALITAGKLASQREALAWEKLEQAAETAVEANEDLFSAADLAERADKLLPPGECLERKRDTELELMANRTAYRHARRMFQKKFEHLELTVKPATLASAEALSSGRDFLGKRPAANAEGAEGDERPAKKTRADEA